MGSIMICYILGTTIHSWSMWSTDCICGLLQNVGGGGGGGGEINLKSLTEWGWGGNSQSLLVGEGRAFMPCVHECKTNSLDICGQRLS